MAKFACHMQYRRGEIDLAFGAVKMRGKPATRLYPFQLFQKIDVKVGSPEFAIGHALQAEIFLQADDVANRAIFGLTKVGLGDCAFPIPLARVQQFLRAQKTADVIRAKWGSGALCHGRVLSVSLLRLSQGNKFHVVPANAGTQRLSSEDTGFPLPRERRSSVRRWVPACAGTTV